MASCNRKECDSTPNQIVQLLVTVWRVAIGKGVLGGGGGGRIPDFGPKLYTVVSLFSITVLFLSFTTTMKMIFLIQCTSPERDLHVSRYLDIRPDHRWFVSRN